MTMQILSGHSQETIRRVINVLWVDKTIIPIVSLKKWHRKRDLLVLEMDDDIISYVEVIIQKDIELSRNTLTLKKGSVSIPG